MKMQIRALAIALAIVIVGATGAIIGLGLALSASNSKVASLEAEQERLEKRVENVAIAACLMEGYGLTKNARAKECQSIVEFIVTQKTDEEIEKLLAPMKYLQGNI